MFSGKGNRNLSESEKKILSLEKELKEAKLENEILKKAVGKFLNKKVVIFTIKIYPCNKGFLQLYKTMIKNAMLKEKVQLLAQKFHPEVVNFRRHLHQYPELSFQEYNTCKFVNTQLETFSEQKWWAGGFLLKWYPDIYSSSGEGSRKRDYTPQGKMAQKVLKVMFH